MISFKLHVFSILLLFLLPITTAFGQEIIFSEDFESGELNDQYWSVERSDKGSGALGKLVSGILGASEDRNKNDESEGKFVGVVDRLENVDYIPHSGKYALVLGRTTPSRELTVNKADLKLDLSNKKEATLRFYIRDQKDETEEDDAIFLSDNGGKDFEKALQLQPQRWGDDEYGAIAIDLAAAAQKLGLKFTNQFVVRFQQTGSRGFAGLHRDGLFIDDIMVFGAPTYVRPPFKDSFESDVLGSAWRMADPNNRGETAMDIMAQWGMVEPVKRLKNVSEISHTGEGALALGIKAWARDIIVNAADLHLDLEGKKEATLRFYIRDQKDETNEDDALFFSDDGGKNFIRAFDIDPDNRPDDKYSEVVLDLAGTAQQLGLRLTDKFIIRFQQSGSRSFAGLHRDGFFIDDVTVDAPLTINEQITKRIDMGVNQWKQCGKFEKSEDCEARRKDSTRIVAVRDSLTQQVLADLAEDNIDWNSASNTYDADSETFTIVVEGLEPFKVAVPLSEAEAMDKNFGKVQFQNATFKVGAGEALRVTKVEVTNPATGKTYVSGSNQ